MTPVKLPDGRWRVRAVVTVSGTQRRRQFTADKKGDVLRLAQDWIAAQSRPAQDLTVAEAVRRHIDARAGILSPSSVLIYNEMYELRLRSLDAPVQYFDQLAAQAFISSLFAEGLAHRTATGYWKLLRASLADAVPDRVYKVKFPTRQKKEIYCPDDTTMRRVFAAAKGTPLELPILLAASIPARRGEICALTAEDFSGRTVRITKTAANTENGWIIKAPKTPASVRTVVLPEAVLPLLPKEGKVYAETPDALTASFNRFLLANGLPVFTFHKLRHYGASVMLTMGVPFKEVQRRGGWESAQILQDIYAHALADQRPTADAMISDHFGALLG